MDAGTAVNTGAEFGQPSMKKKFCFKYEYIPLNHGSYGSVPRKVLDYQIRMIEERESDPEEWYRYSHDDRYMDAVAKVAEFIGCNKDNLVLVENTTSGINSVIKSIKWNTGDAILCTDHTYGANMKLVDFVSNENEGVEVMKMKIPLPITDEDEVVDAYEKMLEQSPEIKLAIIDHITSCSAIVLPIQKLTTLCHEKGVLVVIDAAHAPGQIQVDLEALGADYYIGNMHKWAFCPRGCAILWIHPSHHDSTHPVVQSQYQFHTRLQDRFMMQATRDPSPFFVAPKAIEFYRDLGGMNAVIGYNTTLRNWASLMLSEAWNSTCLPIPDCMKAPCMILVGLPETAKHYLSDSLDTFCSKMMTDLKEKYKIYTVISIAMGKLWCRLSIQVYNSKEDYFKLRDAVLDLLKE